MYVSHDHMSDAIVDDAKNWINDVTAEHTYTEQQLAEELNFQLKSQLEARRGRVFKLRTPTILAQGIHSSLTGS